METTRFDASELLDTPARPPPISVRRLKRVILRKYAMRSASSHVHAAWPKSRARRS